MKIRRCPWIAILRVRAPKKWGYIFQIIICSDQRRRDTCFSLFFAIEHQDPQRLLTNDRGVFAEFVCHEIEPAKSGPKGELLSGFWLPKTDLAELLPVHGGNESEI